MSTDIRWLGDQIPELQQPLLLVAFGSSHAGSTAAALVGLLREQFNTQPLAEIDPDPFYDFTVARPVTRLNEAGERVLDWPENRFDLLRVGDRDVVLFSGLEPHLRWNRFAAAFAEVAATLGVWRTVFLGTHPGAVPHTRLPLPRLFGADRDVAELFGLAPVAPSYQGPAGIEALLSVREAEEGRLGARLMALTPFYAAVDPNPYGALVLAELLAQRLGLDADLTAVHEILQPLAEQLRHALARSEAFRELVANLEREVERGALSAPAETHEVGALLEEIDAFLSQHGRSHGGPSGSEVRGPAGA